jgi:hypothetical protein
MICTAHQILFDGDQIEKNKMGEVRSTYVVDERFTHGFGGET